MSRAAILVLAALAAFVPGASAAHAIGGLSQAPPQNAQTIDRIMAVVAGQPITLSDVEAAMVFGIVPPAPSGTADPVGYALERLIERALMLTEVDRYQPPEPAPEEIETRLAAMKARVGERAELDLRATGLTDDSLRRYIRDDLRTETYLNQRFGTADPATRTQLISDWLGSLRRRADIAVLYLGK